MHDVLEIVKIFLKIVEIFFLLYLFFYSVYLFLSATIGSSTLFTNRYKNKMENKIKHDYYVPVSILVPAYNEEKTIIKSIESLLYLDYKLYEIIIINDGSTDNTLKILIDKFNLNKVDYPINKKLKTQKINSVYENNNQIKIIVIDKENGGKADSLNAGINVARYPYFATLDADSLLQKDSLEMLVRPVLEDNRVIACGGFVKLANSVKLDKGNIVKYSMDNNVLVNMQILEYNRAFLASRIMLDKFNGNLIISGAFGLFKKDIAIAIGGYETKTVGEDFEIVVKMHRFCLKNKIDYLIKYVPEAICWTQAPNNLKDLIKQRRRWYIGLFQTMVKHKEIAFNIKYKWLSLISYNYFLFFELLAPFIEVFGLIATIIAIAFNLINFKFMILFFFIYALFGVIISLTTFLAQIHVLNLRISFLDFIKSMFICFFEVTILRFILMIVRLTSFIGYKNKKLNWDKLAREELNS